MAGGRENATGRAVRVKYAVASNHDSLIDLVDDHSAQSVAQYLAPRHFPIQFWEHEVYEVYLARVSSISVAHFGSQLYAVPIEAGLYELEAERDDGMYWRS
jgi:hypothetical protein